MFSDQERDAEDRRASAIQPPPPDLGHEPVNVADFMAIARQKLPRATFEYIAAGSQDGITLQENLDAFRRIQLLTRVLHGVAEADLETTIVGQRVSMPILLAPVAGLRLYHPDGALAAARAAATAKTIVAVSSSACHGAEEIAAASTAQKWFQLYVPTDRNVTRNLVQRVERAGYRAIVVTVDLGERKDADMRNRFSLPRDVLLKHLRDIGHDLPLDMAHEKLLAFNEKAWDMGLNWDIFARLRDTTRLPLLVKGVLTPEDAEKAVSLGLDGIVVSNHGGRRLDGVPASIDVLPEIAAAVGDKIDLLLDSGVRRGTDVLKAIARGAKAVLVGRAYAWALAAGGEPAVSRLLQLLRDELTNAMLATGCARVEDISPSVLRN